MIWCSGRLRSIIHRRFSSSGSKFRVFTFWRGMSEGLYFACEILDTFFLWASSYACHLHESKLSNIGFMHTNLLFDHCMENVVNSSCMSSKIVTPIHQIVHSCNKNHYVCARVGKMPIILIVACVYSSNKFDWDRQNDIITVAPGP